MSPGNEERRETPHAPNSSDESKGAIDALTGRRWGEGNAAVATMRLWRHNMHDGTHERALDPDAVKAKLSETKLTNAVTAENKRRGGSSLQRRKAWRGANHPDSRPREFSRLYFSTGLARTNLVARNMDRGKCCPTDHKTTAGIRDSRPGARQQYCIGNEAPELSLRRL